MSSPSKSSVADIPRQAIEEAAAFRARQSRGALSPEDAEALHAWLQAAPQNAQAWSRHNELWDRLEGVRQAPAVAAMREAALIRLRRQGRRKRISASASALAAGVVIAAIAWRLHTPADDVVRGSASSPLLSQRIGSVKTPPLLRNASTKVGERALIQLSDGSQVTLNTDSAIHADMSGSVRSVTLLRGEAYFDVAKDAIHPFVVTAGTRHIVAVGTAFDVNLQPQGLRINLVQGKVRVEHSVATPILMGAGSSLVTSSSGEEHLEPLDVEREVGWRSGKLVFQDERVATVVAEMNRYSNTKIELRDPDIGDRLLSGVFDPSGVAELARVLESYRLARIVTQDRTVIVLGSPLTAPDEK